MGDRISISFVNGADHSPALFSHWGGTSFLAGVDLYLNELREEISKLDHPNSYPLDRLEPGTVMVDFIRWTAECELAGVDRQRITCNFYLGKDSEDGDNSDNGHVEIDLTDRGNSWLHYCNCGDLNCTVSSSIDK
jgi:hypothetical protein